MEETTVITYERSKKDKTYYIVNFTISVLCAAFVILLRRGVLPNFIYIFDIPFSTSDFFVILAAGLCGYRFGVLTFGIIFTFEVILSFGDASQRVDFSMLYSLFAYLLVAAVSGYFSAHRWYVSLKRSFFAFLSLAIILVNAWYILFVFLLPGAETAYDGLTVEQLMLGSNPETALAVLLLYLCFRFLPDQAKLKLGMGYLYTDSYMEYEKSNAGIRKSTLGSKVTLMSFIEAVIISIFCVVFFDFQLIMPARAEFAGANGGNLLGNGTLSSDIVEQGLLRGGRPLFMMNLQLILMTLSVSLPIAVLFNEIILHMVVRPVNRMSDLMDKFFSGEREELQKHLDVVNRLHIHSGDEMEKLAHNLQKMVHDMSEHIDSLEKERQLEAELKIAEAKSEAKSTFLSNMSHEIRTPINAVLGMDEMILRESREEATLRYAENIRTAGNTLLGLVNDILDFSKIEAGKMDIIEVDYDFASTLNDLVNMIGPRAEAKELSLIVNVNPALPNLLHGDEIRFKQVVTNILTNAVKYTETGSITLRVDFERISDDTATADVLPSADNSSDAEEAAASPALPQLRLLVSVKDTGIGIKEEDLAKLFSAFERIEEERNRTIEGTGLGMNITQSLLNMMGSRLEVQSVYGEGSEFSFALTQGIVSDKPIGDYEEALRRSVAERKRYHESFTAPDAQILVVDDTAMNLTVIENLLKKTLVQIDTAQSGAECLTRTEKKRYDLIFLDHRMPEKDGIETLAELRADSTNPNLSTPAVCLTANAVSGARSEYLAAGFTDYLTKPIDPNKLEELLVRYLPPEKVYLASETADSDVPDPAAASDIPSSLPDFLTAIPALDPAQGIAHCGSGEAYLSALTVYEEAAPSNLTEIRQFYEAEDLPNYTIKVHALKSSSRIIGAEALGALAEQLENAGNTGDLASIRAHTDELLAMLSDLSEKLRPLVADTSSDSANEAEDTCPPIDAGELRDAYDTLKELAAAFDYDSFLFVMESLAQYRLPDTDAKRYNALRAAIKTPDWDAVGELLREV